MKQLKEKVIKVIESNGGYWEVDWWLFLRGIIIEHLEVDSNGNIIHFDTEGKIINNISEAELIELYEYIVTPME